VGTPPRDLQPGEIEAVLTFLRAAERLKTVARSGWTSTGDPESVAEHTWRLCLMAMLFYGRNPGVDVLRLLKMCVIHDLGEALSGDVPAPAQVEGNPKATQERSDLLDLIQPLPPALQQDIVELWDEYEAGDSVEGRLAKGLDKLETILQHTQGRNPPGFDYAFNLDYGKRYTSADQLMAEVRARLDKETARLSKSSRAAHS
jgi:putative hydrolase of HD superfamily